MGCSEIKLVHAVRRNETYARRALLYGLSCGRATEITPTFVTSSLMRYLPALLMLVFATSVVPVKAQTDQETAVSRFQLAESYLRAGQFDRAISLLEQLYAADPSSFVFYDRLKGAYVSVKRYDDALELLNTRLQSSPTPMLMAERARILHLAGDAEAAYRAWDDAVRLAPSSRGTYQVVYRSLVEARLFDRAIDLLVEGRRALGDESSFRADLSALYLASGRFKEATAEQIELLRDDARHLTTITTMLSRQVDQTEVLEAAREAVEVAVREDPLNRGFRELLAWIYLESGNYDGALNENRAIDRLEKQEGRVLLAFATRAADASAFQAAADAYADILDRYPDADAAPQALFGLGQLYETWAAWLAEEGAPLAESSAHLRSALAAYDRFALEHAHHPFYPSVLRSRGHLQLDALQDLDQAEQTLLEVVQRFGRSDDANKARLDLGKIEVLRGNFDGALIRFNGLVDELRIGNIAEEARFEAARVHYYRGEFEAARALLNVLDVNTSSEVANDALELKMIIIGNQGPDSLNLPLHRFAEAELDLRRHNFDEALATIDDLLRTYGRHQIADEARFARASIFEAMASYQDAWSAFAELPQMHPESHLADRSLYRAAAIQEHALSDVPGAVQTLTRLLRDYPGSVYAQAARERIRRLRGDAL